MMSGKFFDPLPPCLHLDLIYSILNYKSFPNAVKEGENQKIRLATGPARLDRLLTARSSFPRLAQPVPTRGPFLTLEG